MRERGERDGHSADFFIIPMAGPETGPGATTGQLQGRGFDPGEDGLDPGSQTPLVWKVRTTETNGSLELVTEDGLMEGLWSL
jgi:hypothetical protein